jgi:hypothetical protein
MSKNQGKKNFCWGKFGKEHPSYGHSFSEEGITALKDKGVKQGIEHREKLPKILEIHLDTFAYNIYQNPNKFLNKTLLDWNKVRYVLQRNFIYAKENRFPRMITPTYKSFWCTYITAEINVNHYIEVVKKEVGLLQRKKLFDELYQQEKSLLNQSIRFPITAKEALDDFYHKNIFFLIYKQKTKREKKLLFLTYRHFKD